MCIASLMTPLPTSNQSVNNGGKKTNLAPGMATIMIQMIVTSFLDTVIDYLQLHALAPLLSIPNTVARVTLEKPKSNHIIPLLLQRLHFIQNKMQSVCYDR